EMTIEVLVGEQGKLFGSVTSRDIAERLHKDTGVELEHRQVSLNQPIREIGTHEVPVKLTRNVIANITVNVHPEGGMPEPEPEPELEPEPDAAEAASEAEAETAETVAEEPAASEATEDESSAEEAAPAPEEESTTETSAAPEATEDEEKGNASQDGS
ncbi:MAG TPA: 50S ribosomal protein L9, partial [Dehalococcoidia bacterium]